MARKRVQLEDTGWRTNGHNGGGGADDVVTITPLGRYLLEGMDMAHARALAETGCTLEMMQGQLPLPTMDEALDAALRQAEAGAAIERGRRGG